MSGLRPPTDCPVCGDELVTSRLGCPGCGTELSGHFARCAFCALDAKELELLTVFLSSRGNLREVEKHLGVSYPTARARFTDLLVKLGLAGEPDAASDGSASDAPASGTREQVLAQVAAGTLAPDQAAALLARL
ncbi:MAG TPA: DUF2089 domain-containing protein [Micropruina sp.]|nr:DUF2089 domain-containing protein [Propionibacterium sp.]HMQ36115.1 DUF2089 domain-containing protein [Micropruina sp.]HMR20528.1 DUF2089 domain-containing protein [Micropruina sp.]